MIFINTFVHYLIEVAPSLFLGFFLSGIIHEFIPQSWINRYLNKKGILPLLYVTAAGVVLPLCCFGSLPVAMGFRKKGVPLGPVLAFLVATPATSVTAILVTWRLMGIGFTLYLAISVIVIGIVMGLIGNMIPESAVPAHEEEEACAKCESGVAHSHLKTATQKFKSALIFGFWDMPRDIGLEVIIGLLLAAAVASMAPVGDFIQKYLSGFWGYPFALVFGVIMYICSTASVPLVHAFTLNGINLGAGLVLLIAGPVTSYGAILVIRKKFGGRVLAIYITVISTLALALGYGLFLING